MAEDRIKEAIHAHDAIGVDTMAFIYHLEANKKYTPFTHTLFEAIETGACRGVTSTLTLMETLVRPKEIGDTDMRDDYVYALTTFPNLTMRAVDAAVAEAAAELRARHRLRPPDAIQVATCIVEGGTAFVTNDERLKKIENPKIIIMEDYL